MDAALRASIEALIADETGSRASIAGDRAVSGGCINDARVLAFDDGRRFFVKSNPAPLDGLFEREAEGLAALRDVGAIRVPEPIGTGGEPGTEVPPFIVIEAVEPGTAKPSFHASFGRAFAELHRKSAEGAASGGRFGFDRDNYIGATPQPNSWSRNWCEFWRDHRLGFQLELARKLGRSDATLARLGDRLLGRLDAYLAEPDEPPTLLHGDLWSGNYMVDETGAPVLIDPAVYYGRREADIAMTRLFGGFGTGFYAAYEEAWPFADGAGVRIDLYMLYHVLNHLNLFGSSYYGQCVEILRRYV